MNKIFLSLVLVSFIIAGCIGNEAKSSPEDLKNIDVISVNWSSVVMKNTSQGSFPIGSLEVTYQLPADFDNLSITRQVIDRIFEKDYYPIVLGCKTKGICKETIEVPIVDKPTDGYIYPTPIKLYFATLAYFEDELSPIEYGTYFYLPFEKLTVRNG